MSGTAHKYRLNFDKIKSTYAWQEVFYFVSRMDRQIINIKKVSWLNFSCVKRPD